MKLYFIYSHLHNIYLLYFQALGFYLTFILKTLCTYLSRILRNQTFETSESVVYTKYYKPLKISFFYDELRINCCVHRTFLNRVSISNVRRYKNIIIAYYYIVDDSDWRLLVLKKKYPYLFKKKKPIFVIIFIIHIPHPLITRIPIVLYYVPML